MNELIIDNFAGGGGASTGIEMAFGRAVDIAVNHDPLAIAMYKINHPHTKVLCESVWDIDPVKVTGGKPVALCWLSPDCKHFSKAKGGKPVEKRIRGLAWVAVRWAATVKPRVIILENVEEFKSWGPLLENGKPCPKRKGNTFNAFINALKRQGYKVDYRELKACDYGAPTSRKRLFLIARCDGQPIRWPEPTHGSPDDIFVKTGVLKPWRTAAEIIDWSIPCPSIFERKRPLAENTMRRIARGIQKFVIDNPDPFIIKVNHPGEDFRGQKTDKPMQTITAKNGWGIVTPFVTRIGQTGFGTDRMQYPVDKPLTTVISKAEHLLVSPTLIQTGYGERKGQSPRVPGLGKPLGTVVAGSCKHALVSAFIARHHGQSVGKKMDKPIGLVTVQGEDYQIVDIGMRMLEPHELFAAQGFPEDYIIDHDCDGNKFSKATQVAKCGNAVPPQFAEAIVKANLIEGQSKSQNKKYAVK